MADKNFDSIVKAGTKRFPTMEFVKVRRCAMRWMVMVLDARHVHAHAA